MYFWLRSMVDVVALAVLPLIVQAEEPKNYFGAGLELSRVDLTGMIENLSGTTRRVAEKIDTNLETFSNSLDRISFSNSCSSSVSTDNPAYLIIFISFILLVVRISILF